MPCLSSRGWKVFQKVTEVFQEYYYLRLHRLHQFEPKIFIDQKVGSFRVKTATSLEELKKAFQLRYQVFHHEFKGVEKSTGWDIDEYDFLCDHLIIIDEKNFEVVGTYRLNCSAFSSNFYSSREFNLDRILAQEGIKTELGRACIHRLYRRGVVISLLWKGISEYMRKSRSQILFGCASFQVRTPRQAALLNRYFFEEKKYAPEYFSPPTLAYKMPDFEPWALHFKKTLSQEERAEAEQLIPALCRAYLKMGAFLGGEPAWDEEFRCIDFLTILHREDLNRSLWSKYKTEP